MNKLHQDLNTFSKWLKKNKNKEINIQLIMRAE